MSQVAIGYVFIVACAVLVIVGDTLSKLTARIEDIDAPS